MIYDTSGNTILSAEFDLESEEEKTFDIKIDCEDGHFLRSNPATVTIEARKSGESVWTDIRSEQIDLSAYSGLTQPVTFNIRLTAPEVEAYEREDVRLAVGRNINPDVPLNFTAVTQSSSSVLTSWSYPSDSTNVAGYQRRINCPAMGITNLVTDLGLTYENLVVGITAATEIFFELRAYNLNGDVSGWTEQISATTDA